jgi:hypothetical protein
MINVNDPLIEFDYENLPDDVVIAEILRLAQSPEANASRKFSRLSVYYLEDCKELKKADAMDQMLLAILEVKSNFPCLASILRTSYSERNSLKHWYDARDQALIILKREVPDRAERLLIGLREANPHMPEEMEGLTAMQRLLKHAKEFQ